MLLTISTTYRPASDLGYLLEKHPARVHEVELAGGKATVFYSEVGEERCTVALLLDVDPVGLVRGNRPEAALQQYVNDRPYVASSLMSVALNAVFRSALGGRSRERAELAATPIPLQACLPVLPSRGGAELLRSLFEPLGYELTLQQLPLDTHFVEWGDSPYFSVTLAATCTLQRLLQHLYVLIPVLDDDKHYWVGDAEVDKLLRHAEQWLGAHPQRERIALRYLKHRRSLAHEALSRLTPEDTADADDVPEAAQPEPQIREQTLERKSNLNEQRIAAVQAAIAELDSTSVVDLGCGEGKILAALLQLRQLEKVVGMDVSLRSLERAQEHLNLDRMPPRVRQRISLLHGSLIYRDARLAGFDAATLIEVIEHLDPGRLAALERVVFQFARPRHVIVTTPNCEYNVRYTTLAPGQFRHGDHRFEWTRAEFRGWCEQQTERFGYRVAYRGIGEEDAQLGPPTQMALFSLGPVARA
jgi:3' terminal RNA ribose 2'-O-methyltransferase Hen1